MPPTITVAAHNPLAIEKCRQTSVTCLTSQFIRELEHSDALTDLPEHEKGQLALCTNLSPLEIEEFPDNGPFPTTNTSTNPRISGFNHLEDTDPGYRYDPLSPSKSSIWEIVDTWLYQNKLFSTDQVVINSLIQRIEGKTKMRTETIILHHFDPYARAEKKVKVPCWGYRNIRGVPYPIDKNSYSYHACTKPLLGNNSQQGDDVFKTAVHWKILKKELLYKTPHNIDAWGLYWECVLMESIHEEVQKELNQNLTASSGNFLGECVLGICLVFLETLLLKLIKNLRLGIPAILASCLFSIAIKYLEKSIATAETVNQQNPNCQNKSSFRTHLIVIRAYLSDVNQLSQENGLRRFNQKFKELEKVL